MNARLGLVLLIAGWAAGVGAQGFSGPIDLGWRHLIEGGWVKPEDQPNPTEPSGNPPPPATREGDLPVLGEGPVFHLIHADQFSTDGPLIHASGGVEFTARGYYVRADDVLGNRETETYTMTGHVTVIGKDESVYGDTVQVNFRTRKFVAETASSTLKPPLVQGQIRDNLYVKAHRSYGSEREVWSEDSLATTCPYPSPHFAIVAEKMDVRTGRRVIFRKLKIVILGHTVLALPYLSVPLDERNYNNLPQVGQGRLEGYFIKTRYGIPLKGDDAFDSRFDYYSRLGTGLGGDYHYDDPRIAGIVRLYTIVGPHHELDLSAQHKQNFGWAQFSFDGSYQNDNYLLASGGTLLNLRSQLLIPQGKSSSRLSYFQAGSDSFGSSTLQQTLTLDDNRIFSKALKTSLNVGFSQNESHFGGGEETKRDQVNVTFKAESDLQRAIARLDYLRSIPIGETTNFFTISDVTPNLTLASDAKRLFGKEWDRKFPFQTELSFGEFGDPITSGRLSRGNFDFAFRNPQLTGNHWQIGYQGEFKQSFYSDNTAQYVLVGGTQITYLFHNRSSFNFRYNYLRPYGYTPLQIDRRGRTNIAQADLSYFPIRNLQLGIQTAYDFNLLKDGTQTPWQQVGLRGEYTLGRSFKARVISNYDTVRHAYGSTRIDVTWLPGSTYVSLGAKYDGIRNRWAALNLYVDGFQIGRLRTAALLNYNGYTHRFDAQQYSFIYDLHCAEAVLQILDNGGGFNSGRTVTFFIRLKALPWSSGFGTGANGQPIGTGSGRD